MNRHDVILAGLAAAEGADHSPVQVQKLFFLLDQKAAHQLEGPHFDFRPYDYGPFDRTVYDELRTLTAEGLVEMSADQSAPWRKYRLTPEGQRRGQQILSGLSGETAAYLRTLSQWVRSLSFAQLVSAVYKAYPEMKAKSVFRG